MVEEQMCLFWAVIAGCLILVSCKCEIQNLRCYDDGSYIACRWYCNQPDTIFNSTYQLLNAGMCDTGNVTGFPPIRWHDSERSSISVSRNYLHVNSTYLFTVQAKHWQSGRGFVYGPQNGVYVSTLENIGIETPSTSFDSIWTSWRNPYPDCGNAVYEYQLYTEHDEQLVNSNTTGDNGFTISGLLCYTRYRLRVGYITNTGIGEDGSFTVITDIQDVEQHTVELTGVSGTSLSYTWNEYEHCNNNSVQIVYRYQLRRRYGYSSTIDGDVINTFISFNNLEPGTEYTFGVDTTVNDLLTAGTPVNVASSILNKRTTPAPVFGIDECASYPCKLGISCIDGVGGFTCDCPAGYTGVNCETPIDECASNPCRNDGVCIDEVNGYICNCTEGFTGGKCEININECASYPCQHGGICIDGVNNYTCNCAARYTGAKCETDIHDCVSNPCQNGGVCAGPINGYTCNCIAGYTGANCETDINECASSPCQNEGVCMEDTINGYTCSCSAWYTGVLCETGAGGDEYKMQFLGQNDNVNFGRFKRWGDFEQNFDK